MSEYVEAGLWALVLIFQTATFIVELRDFRKRRRSDTGEKVAERLRGTKPPRIVGDEDCDGYGSAHGEPFI